MSDLFEIKHVREHFEIYLDGNLYAQPTQKMRQKEKLKPIAKP
jgi:hypothetical protein